VKSLFSFDLRFTKRCGTGACDLAASIYWPRVCLLEIISRVAVFLSLHGHDLAARGWIYAEVRGERSAGTAGSKLFDFGESERAAGNFPTKEYEQLSLMKITLSRFGSVRFDNDTREPPIVRKSRRKKTRKNSRLTFLVVKASPWSSLLTRAQNVSASGKNFWEFPTMMTRLGRAKQKRSQVPF